jgi:hypothetical protein
MFLPDRKVLTGMVLGALSAMGVAVIGPGTVIGAIADEAPVGIDPSSLVKFEGQNYDVQYDDWVDTTPTSKARVKKIEFGRVSYVDITYTGTGTYSTDAMFSGTVQYPGITVTRAPSDTASALSVIGLGGNWVVLPLAPGNSFVHIKGRGHSTFSGNGVSCFFGRYTTSC